MFGIGGVIGTPSLASRPPGQKSNTSQFVNKNLNRGCKYDDVLPLPGSCEPSIFTLKRDEDLRSRVSVVRPSQAEPNHARARVSHNYVHIIVSGQKFTTLKDTLSRFPESRLGDEEQRKKHWDEKRGAYVFINRCRQSFESILYFYQSNGHLVQPINVGQERFMKEVMFFKLPIHDDLDNAAIDLGYDTVQNLSTVPRKLQKLMDSERSVCMRILAVVDNTTTVLYVFTQLIVTLPSFHWSKSNFVQAMHAVVAWMERSCIVWFMILYLLRLVSAKNRKVFAKKFLNVIDVLVVLSYLVNQIVMQQTSRAQCVTTQAATNFEVCILMSSVITMIGLLRLFNFARYSELLYCLGIALKRSLPDLAQVLFMIVLLTYMFACLAYFLEVEDKEHGIYTFASVFDALYWGTITISTVGYGDIAPVTKEGKFIGAALALLGLPLIAIPMPLIMSKFDSYYQNVKQRRKTNEMSRKLMKEAQQEVTTVIDQSEADSGPGDLEDRKNMSWMLKARGAYDNCILPEDEESPPHKSPHAGKKSPNVTTRHNETTPTRTEAQPAPPSVTARRSLTARWHIA